MQLTPEQVGILFTVVTGLLVALTQYLTRLATKSDVAAVQTKVDAIHATLQDVQPVPPPPTTLFVDGHGLPIETPPKALPW